MLKTVYQEGVTVISIDDESGYFEIDKGGSVLKSEIIACGAMQLITMPMKFDDFLELAVKATNGKITKDFLLSATPTILDKIWGLLKPNDYVRLREEVECDTMNVETVNMVFDKITKKLSQTQIMVLSHLKGNMKKALIDEIHTEFQKMKDVDKMMRINRYI